MNGEMDPVSFRSDGVVGVNLSAIKLDNGTLQFCRSYQTAYIEKVKSPEFFTITAEEKTDVVKYLQSQMNI